MLAESHLLVGPMTDDEVHAAIEEPAHRAGLTLETGLADAIAADVADQPGALPLLSTALLETWVRRRDRTLTHAGYHDAGGVGGAVARLAENTYLQLTLDEQRECRQLLLRLAEPAEDSDDVRRRVPLVELGDTHVLQTLVARRLVTTSDGAAEVAHEALLREWPRLRSWLEETVTVAGSTTASRPRRSTGTLWARSHRAVPRHAPRSRARLVRNPSQ